jgi:hypothetical protein
MAGGASPWPAAAESGYVVLGVSTCLKRVLREFGGTPAAPPSSKSANQSTYRTEYLTPSVPGGYFRQAKRQSLGTFSAASSSKGRMKHLSVVFLVLVLVGCSAWPFSGGDNEDDFRVPLVCGPEHNKLPCTAGVEEGVGYRFNLLTHCGIEWAYLDGRYWVPMPMLDEPSHWAGIEAGTIVLEQPGVAIFEADEGGGARFVPAPRSYRPPDCE